MHISVLIYIYLSKAILSTLAHVLYPNCVLESVCYISQQEQQYFFLPLHELLVDVSTTTNVTETQSNLKVKSLVNLWCNVI